MNDQTAQTEVGQLERATQNRVVKLFREKLGYEYFGNWEEKADNAFVEERILREWLAGQGYNETLQSRAIDKLQRAAAEQSRGLYYVNKEVYTLLRYGAPVSEDVSKKRETVNFIDWTNFSNNRFSIAEEVTVKGTNEKRPDIVIYINGIALGVIELKRSTVSVTEGIRQNLDNQQNYFIKSFFAAMQLVLAGNDTQGIRYGTTETPEKFYLAWKEENETGAIENLLDRHVSQLCEKNRFLEIVRDFLIFDGGVKKIARPNQYFGVKAAQSDLRRREGGIIWHTQGSGKSLTMVWLARWIRENLPASRVLIITDRDELDRQIERVFSDVEEKVVRTRNGRELLARLNLNEDWLICSLIHKFRSGAGSKDAADYEGYLNEIEKNLPPNFAPKGDIFVFVDECHRTQSGKLHEAMKRILPNSIFVGFTGTPLLKNDKQTSLEIFGKYIHTYKFNEAVEDKVILDLRYEARRINQEITSEKKIDEWFSVKTRGLPDHAKEDLKRRWGTMQKLLSSRSRLEKIVNDIMFDFDIKDRLMNGKGNAILISGSIYESCKYYEMFQSAGFLKCAIVTSYVPAKKDLKGESTGEELLTEKLRKYKIYEEMLGGRSVEDFEEDAKRRFVKEPGQMKLLIVVDKLLTGFDAPSATYLYIDKKMRDHGLFQAICRVNRPDGEDKEFGYIVDYKDLFQVLEKTVTDYTSEAFENFDRKDVEGLLADRLKKGRERLDNALEAVKALCETVPPPMGQIEFQHYFCGRDATDKNGLKKTEQQRVALYKNTAALTRAFADIATSLEEAGYSAAGAEEIKRSVKFYEKLREEIMIASGDFVDLKGYEASMRHLIDTYIRADESEKITDFNNLTLVELIVERGVDALNSLPKSIRENKAAAAEAIENNLRRVIVDKSAANPVHFAEMSRLLDELIKQRQLEILKYEQYLARIVEISRNLDGDNSNSYPAAINTSAKRALYDNVERNENLATSLDAAVLRSRRADWRGDNFKEKEIRGAIRGTLSAHGGASSDTDEISRLFEIIKKQKEY